MRAGLAFFLGAWLGWIVAAAVSVYVLGQAVRPYNRSASFGILASAAILPACAIGVAAFVGAKGSALPWRRLAGPAAAMGLLCSVIFFCAEALEAAPAAVGMAVVWIALPLAAFFGARALARRAARSTARP